jgi:hypothetical protein
MGADVDQDHVSVAPSPLTTSSEDAVRNGPARSSEQGPDQFEELWTAGADQGEREAFVDTVLSLLTDAAVAFAVAPVTWGAQAHQESLHVTGPSPHSPRAELEGRPCSAAAGISPRPRRRHAALVATAVELEGNAVDRVMILCHTCAIRLVGAGWGRRQPQ